MANRTALMALTLKCPVIGSHPKLMQIPKLLELRSYLLHKELVTTGTNFQAVRIWDFPLALILLRIFILKNISCADYVAAKAILSSTNQILN